MPSRQRFSLTEDLTIYHTLEQKKRLLDVQAEADDSLRRAVWCGVKAIA